MIQTAIIFILDSVRKKKCRRVVATQLNQQGAVSSFCACHPHILTAKGIYNSSQTKTVDMLESSFLESKSLAMVPQRLCHNSALILIVLLILSYPPSLLNWERPEILFEDYLLSVVFTFALADFTLDKQP